MMFFQDTRSIGLVFWIVVVLLLINAAIVFLGFFFEDLVNLPDYVVEEKLYCLLIGAGSLISAIIYARNAHKVMSVKMTRLQVLRSYVLTVGLCTVLGGVFGGLAVYLATSEPTSGIILTVATIVIGLFVILISIPIGNGKKGILKKAIWVILVIAFVLMALDALLPASTYWEFAENVAHLLIAVFMLAFILDGDVRKEMGVKS